MIEQWCKIPGFPDYEISNRGQIFRIGKTKRTPVKTVKGYVSLSYAPYRSKQVNLKQVLDKCFTEHILSDKSNCDLEGEVWKDAVGWETSYEVSNLGRVRSKERLRSGKAQSVCTVSCRIKKTYLDQDGYERVSLYYNNQSQLLGVHRLVAQTFLPNPENLPQVNHKNGNKSDNRVVNLEWISQNRNIAHSIESGLRDPGFRYTISRLEDGKQFVSAAELAREIDIEYRTLCRMLKDNNGSAIQIGQFHYSVKETN